MWIKYDLFYLFNNLFLIILIILNKPSSKIKPISDIKLMLPDIIYTSGSEY